MRLLTAFTLILVLASASLAQTIYEPVRFQYGSEDRKFYYGGADPHTFRRGAFYGVRTVENEPLRVYTDRLPDVNATTYGFTIDDARNEANNAVPQYFRMSDRYDNAWREGRAVIVPSRPVTPSVDNVRPLPRGTIEIRPYVAPMRRSLDPVIVIPKELLNKPLPTPDGQPKPAAKVSARS